MIRRFDRTITVNLGGFCTLLTILFIGLKLTNFIDWSWLLVVGPLWIPLATVVGGLALFFIAGIIFVILKAVIEELIKKLRKKR